VGVGDQPGPRRGREQHRPGTRSDRTTEGSRDGNRAYRGSGAVDETRAGSGGCHECHHRGRRPRQAPPGARAHRVARDGEAGVQRPGVAGAAREPARHRTTRGRSGRRAESRRGTPQPQRGEQSCQSPAMAPGSPRRATNTHRPSLRRAQQRPRDHERGPARGVRGRRPRRGPDRHRPRLRRRPTEPGHPPPGRANMGRRPARRAHRPRPNPRRRPQRPRERNRAPRRPGRGVPIHPRPHGPRHRHRPRHPPRQQSNPPPPQTLLRLGRSPTVRTPHASPDNPTPGPSPSNSPTAAPTKQVNPGDHANPASAPSATRNDNGRTNVERSGGAGTSR